MHFQNQVFLFPKVNVQKKKKEQAKKNSSQTNETTKPILKNTQTKQKVKKNQVVFHSWEALSGPTGFQQHPSHVQTDLSSKLELCRLFLGWVHSITIETSRTAATRFLLPVDWRGHSLYGFPHLHFLL